MIPSLHFRWLGVAGIELSYKKYTLLIDPYLTRISLLRVLFGRAIPDHSTICKYIKKVDTILVTHSHYDHCMDIPVIAEKYQPHVYGGSNTVMLLEKAGVSQKKLSSVAPGDQFSIGPFDITVLASSHRPLWFLPERTLDHTITRPKRALDYIMDSQIAFSVAFEDITLLTDPGDTDQKRSTSVLFLNTMQKRETIYRILSHIDASMVIPIHWDNSFKPLGDQSKAPRWNLLPVNSISLSALKKKVLRYLPRSKYLIPDIFRSYQINTLFGSNGIPLDSAAHKKM